MAVAFLVMFCRFAMVSTAFHPFLPVPMVRFSTLFSPIFASFNQCACELTKRFWGENNVLSLAFHLISDAIDAMVLQFFLERNMFLLLCCEVSS